MTALWLNPSEKEGWTALDTLSHAAWGYAALRWKGRREGRWGALAGAAPDLLFFIPSKIEQVFERGWSGMFIGGEPGIWRADGPPLPPELVEAYGRYYVKTHSLVILALVALTVYWIGKQSWVWLALPYALHVVMDLPTHERYMTPILYPISDWTIHGISWSDPRVFWPNLIALALTYAWIWRKYRS